MQKESGQPTEALGLQHRSIQSEYRKQAPVWGKAKIDAHLEWVVGQLDLNATLATLDVASGSGLFARSIAPHVKSVIASDLTPEMLEQGRVQAEQAGLKNITFERAPAESLPHPEGTFDLVISRYAVHHFLRPIAVFREMYRVCKPGGRVAIVDMVADEDRAVRDRQDCLEKIVDATHTAVLAPSEFVRELTAAGFALEKYLCREVPMLFESWQSFLPQDAPSRLAVRATLEAELNGGDATGLRPFIDAGQLFFTHTWGLVIGRR